MLIGYARVSTNEQDLQLQLDALEKAGCAEIYQEKATGKHIERPQLAACLKALRAGDTLAVWRLDRLSRSLRDLITEVNKLEARDVQLLSITEKIDTTSAAGKLTFHLFAILAEFERNLIRERTFAGLSVARARGRLGGAKPKTTSTQDRQMYSLWESNKHNAAEIAGQFGVSVPTFHRRVAAYKKAAAEKARKKGSHA